MEGIGDVAVGGRPHEGRQEPRDVPGVGVSARLQEVADDNEPVALGQEANGITEIAVEFASLELRGRFDRVFVDEDGKLGAIYYVRLRQRNEIRGRPVMAWSSAVWMRGE